MAPDRGGKSTNSGSRTRTPVGSRFDPANTQAICDLVADLLGVMVVVTDMEGRALCDVSNPCGLQLAVGNHPRVERHQIEEHRKLCATSGLTTRLTPSYLGLLCARSFIRIGIELAGMVIAGGIAPDEWPPPPEKQARLAERLDLPVEDLAPHLDEVYHLDKSSQQRIVSTLPKVADLISNIAVAKDTTAGATQQPTRRTAT